MKKKQLQKTVILFEKWMGNCVWQVNNHDGHASQVNGYAGQNNELAD